MKEIVIPRVPSSSERKVVKQFMDVIDSSFSNFDTELKFEKELKEAELIFPFDRCLISANNEEIKKKRTAGKAVETNMHCDLDDPLSSEIEDESAILMPLSFQIKKFLELPGAAGCF